MGASRDCWSGSLWDRKNACYPDLHEQSLASTVVGHSLVMQRQNNCCPCSIFISNVLCISLPLELSLGVQSKELNILRGFL